MATETTPAERRWAVILFVTALVVLALGAALVATLGLPGLGVFGLIGTGTIMFLLMAFAIGA